MFLIAIIDLVAAVFFGELTAGKSLNAEFTIKLSVGMFLASLILLYLGTVYHIHQVPDIHEEFRKQEDDFTTAYGEHRQ